LTARVREQLSQLPAQCGEYPAMASTFEISPWPQAQTK